MIAKSRCGDQTDRTLRQLVTADLEDVYRRAGSLAARILQGARPVDLPVEEPTLYQFVVNLKAAQALGLTIPPSILFQADEMIR